MSTARGKIGRLPVALRKRVNTMLRDNATAADILALLKAEGVSGVTPQNISSWKTNGYQEWLSRQERIEQMSARREFAVALAERAAEDGDADLSMASNAASALAVDAIQEVLEDFDPTMLKEMLADKPAKFMSLVDSLTALRRGDQTFIKLKIDFEQHKRTMRSLAEQAARTAAVNGNTDLAKLADEMSRVLGI